MSDERSSGVDGSSSEIDVETRISEPGSDDGELLSGEPDAASATPAPHAGPDPGASRPAPRRFVVSDARAEPKAWVGSPSDQAQLEEETRESASTSVPLKTRTVALPPMLETERYTVGPELIAQGGQGQVWSAHDTHLDRPLAIKVLRPGGSDGAKRRLRREITLTVQLTHPGIVPVFDSGETVDGRPWFAMKRVQGTDLGREITRIFTDEARWTLRRLIELLGRICDAVAYAHENRIVHRDLKPQNVMVGAFGEVLVMDWGLARTVSPIGESYTGDDRGPVGTDGYIAPEYYRNPRRFDRLVDVFGLGGILYRILTGKNPPKTKGGPIELVFGPTWTNDEPLPQRLIEICRAAMHPDPTQRLSSAESLRGELDGWLDGARRRQEAMEIVEQARMSLTGLRNDRQRVAQMRRAALDQLGQVPPFAPVERKLEGWALEDAARREANELALAELGFEQMARAALTRVPDLPEAHDLLAAHYRDRLAEAEARRDALGAQRLDVLLRSHDRGQHTSWLAGDGQLTLITDPPGALVTLHRVIESNRRLVLDEGQQWATTPIIERTLSRGSYVLVVEYPGRAPVRYPVYIDRAAHWTGCPPGGEAPDPIYLPRLDELAPDDVYVPAGPAWLGGDELATEAMDRARIWVDGFVIKQYSVTLREWRDFLEDQEAQGRDSDIERHLPRRVITGSVADALLVRDADGRWIAGQDSAGQPGHLDHPVSLIEWDSAMAYARWFADQTGQPWTLPHDLEWEKAARGVDGRLLPWGDYYEPTWTRVMDSFRGTGRCPVVGEAPEDVSVYGVGDMAGTIRNWCRSTHEVAPPAEGRVIDRPVPDDASRAIRGGAWFSKMSFGRPAVRYASQRGLRARTVGLRLMRPLG